MMSFDGTEELDDEEQDVSWFISGCGGDRID